MNADPTSTSYKVPVSANAAQGVGIGGVTIPPELAAKIEGLLARQSSNDGGRYCKEQILEAVSLISGEIERLNAACSDRIGQLLVDAESLKSELAKRGSEIARVREALEVKGVADVYRDGYAAALADAKSIKIHVTKSDMSGEWIEPRLSAVVMTLQGNLDKMRAALAPQSEDGT